MGGLKIYNVLNGVFYTLYGLWGLILPQRMLAFFNEKLTVFMRFIIFGPCGRL